MCGPETYVERAVRSIGGPREGENLWSHRGEKVHRYRGKRGEETGGRRAQSAVVPQGKGDEREHSPALTCRGKRSALKKQNHSTKRN